MDREIKFKKINPQVQKLRNNISYICSEKFTTFNIIT